MVPCPSCYGPVSVRPFVHYVECPCGKLTFYFGDEAFVFTSTSDVYLLLRGETMSVHTISLLESMVPPLWGVEAIIEGAVRAATVERVIDS